MSNLNKVDIPVAVQHKTKLDLSCDHITSSTFMRMQPVFYRPMIKTEHLSVDAMSQVRPAPVEVPVYGQLKQNLRAFFVPYRLVFPQWENFINDTIGSNVAGNSLVSSPPTIDNYELVKMFINQTYPVSGRLSNPVNTAGDFTYSGQNYDLTILGRHFLTVLESLGYKIIWSCKESNEFYNALNLLAYAKVYVDWYANSQYLNSPEVLWLERIFAFNDPTSHKVLLEPEIYSLLYLVSFVVYDNEDYYVNAWDNPVSPNSGNYTMFTFNDPTASNGAYVMTNSMGSPEMASIPNPSPFPTQIGTTYIHEALKKLTDFQKRHALAGARSIDRVLAQYGIVTDALKMNRSIYVGNQQVNIEFGSIYATADGTTASTSSHTGDFAGAAYGKGSKAWDFQSDEEGVFIIIATIIPNAQLVQGYDRNNRHLSKFDFFQPEFDSLGVQAIEKGEVYVSDDDVFSNDVASYSGVFGFSGRYGEIKRPKSFLTGDLRFRNTFLGYDSWHLFRLFQNTNFGSVTGLTHSLAFTRSEDRDQYNRIFQYTGTLADQFYCFFHFNAASYIPAKPLFETYEFDGGSKQIPTNNGNKVN